MILLKLGSQNNLVTYLQKKLVKLGYTIIVDGVFNDETLVAVKDFQVANGLGSDGTVGGLTWTKIYLKTETPRDTASRIERNNNILYLHPIVRAAVVKVIVQLQSEDIPFRIYEAYRYPQRQADLYAQGRTKSGSIVTYAKPWSSYHQYGLAVDFVLFENGDWSWNSSGTKEAWWAKLHQIGTAEGLMRLNFEIPHMQLAGTSSSALRQGVYPPNGDKTWSDNMKLAIR